MWNIILIIYGIASIVIVLLLIKKPKLITPLLAITMVITAGLFFKEFAPIIDDLFLGVVIIGIVVLLLNNKLKLTKHPLHKVDQLHSIFFFSFIIYLILQSLRSSIMYQDIAMIRWIIFFVSIGFISFILTHIKQTNLERKHMSLLIVIGAIIYTTVYLGAGYYAEGTRNISRWLLQGVEWPQTINVAFISVIAIPAAIFLMAEKKFRYQIFGVLIFIIFFIAGSFYKSKAIVLTLLIFTLIAPTVFSIRKNMFWIIVIILFSTIFVVSNSQQQTIFDYKTIFTVDNFQHQINSSYKTVTGIVTTKSIDIDRDNHLRAPFLAIHERPLTTLFGYGMHTHRFILIPYLEELYGAKHKRADTTGFSSLLVNTGYVGLVLLALNFILLGYRIFIQKNNKGKTILLASLGLTAIWLVLTDVTGITLFYFLIMPGGLLIQLCSNQPQKPQLK